MLLLILQKMCWETYHTGLCVFLFTGILFKYSNAEDFVITQMNLPFAVKATTTSPCQSLNTADLVTRLKDTGQFNPTYMASSMEDAADHFPDLTDKHFIKAAEKYTCDADCQTKTDEFLTLLKKKGEQVPPPEKVSKISDTSTAVQQLSPAVQNWLYYVGHSTQSNPWLFDQQPQSQLNPTLFNPSSPFVRNNQLLPPAPLRIWDPTSGGGRRKRRDAVDQQQQQIGAMSLGRSEKMGASLENLGSSYVLYCSPEGYEEKTGYHRLCGACRALRELPEEYFPRYLNEVRCGGLQCIKGHGQCVQKYMNFDILKNIGTKTCQRWIPYTVSVSVCCDCLISSQSAIFMQLVRNENPTPPRINK